ncbi:MAG: OstA-like protein [Balneolaceae bacterium]|nr:OstA-like protein [Balneolaceae bacterium]
MQTDAIFSRCPIPLARGLSPPVYGWRCALCATVLMVASLCSPIPAEAQDRVTINRANEVIGITVEGERVRKLIGDVSLRTEEMTMFCDSAYQYLEKNEVRAFGNIEINTEEENIYADTLIYFTDVDFSQLRGRVIIEADSATIFSRAVDYRFSTKVGHFLEQVRLEDPDGTLVANTGFYYREPDSAVFRGQVQLADTLQYVEGDSLFINRRSEEYNLYGDVFLDDRENNVVLKGDSLKADSTGRRLLEGNAWLKRFEADTADTAQADTTHIRSRIIHSIRTTTETDTATVINAYHSVRIWSPKFSAVSDTARYESQTETFELTSDPKAWHDSIQLTGPYIKVRLKDEEIDELESYPSPFVVQQDTAIDRLNQVKGDTLIANFTEGEISRIHVFPNGRLLRYTKNDNDEPDGAVDLSSPSILIFFIDGELVEMKAEGPVDGSYLPESQKTSERRLDGFTWNPEQRPGEPEEAMRRRFPPIPDERPFEFPRRYLEKLR